MQPSSFAVDYGLVRDTLADVRNQAQADVHATTVCQMRNIVDKISADADYHVNSPSDGAVGYIEQPRQSGFHNKISDDGQDMTTRDSSVANVERPASCGIRTLCCLKLLSSSRLFVLSPIQIAHSRLIKVLANHIRCSVVLETVRVGIQIL